MADFNFQNLTIPIREKMISEINSDIQNHKLYISTRLNEEGKLNFPDLLKKSALNETEKELSENLQEFFNLKEEVNGKLKKVPSNASVLLSQSEFDRFYIRAVCLEAIKKGDEVVEVYRARDSSWSRAESEALIGTQINASELLTDLRDNIGVAPRLLPEINSGLSVKLI
tara:strand:+ start:120 stop:629 length:510 start_codon:yes stop_codon:yes gene_type:complete